jgi:rSAM/selenodomain-associated transferase 1
MGCLAAAPGEGMTRLYFAAKAPLPGQAKTRLGATIGPAPAADLYRAFLVDLRTRFARAPFEVAWYAAPGSWPAISAIAGGAFVREQRGEGWAERQANLFRETGTAGEGAVVLAATDSPQLTPDRVAQAFTALERHDLVLGPTPDGGYYLVGMNRFEDVLSGVVMSTTCVLGEVLLRASSRQLRVALLETEFDVDTAEDLEWLEAEVGRRDDLAATAAALARLAPAVPA